MKEIKNRVDPGDVRYEDVYYNKEIDYELEKRQSIQTIQQSSKINVSHDY